jgi:hypothetical protein
LVTDPSHFKYLDDDNLEIHPRTIRGAEQKVEISLPKSMATEIPNELTVKPEELDLPYFKVLNFPYEWLWGGPAHKDRGLYLFTMAFSRQNVEDFRSNAVDNRVRAIERYYENFEEGRWRDYVLDNLVVDTYRSKQGYWWVMENKPTVMQHHEKFTLPISDEHQLVVWFWYNEDWVKDNPEWYERRKALSRRILDSVKLSEP